MDVERAEFAGACYGVQRALQLAAEAIEDGRRATTLGPLIHNPQVVAELAARGLPAAGGPEEIEDGAVLIRSHGITPQVRAAIREKGLPIIDATCPFVMKAQKAAARLAAAYGYVVVVGTAGHPEVDGLCAYARSAGGTVAVASCAEDLPDGLSSEAGVTQVGVVVQTTQPAAALRTIEGELARRGVNAQVENTICSATEERQRAAADLAARVDAMVVIGGRNSANTTHLACICEAACANTHHIETTGELDAAWFAGCRRVGVTAGASTPAGYIDAVADVLAAM